MGRVEYDFREGLDAEKIVYKNTSWDWRAAMYYLGYLLLTWAWAAGWFALFHYAYIYNEQTAFWTYIGIWLAFIGVLLFIIIRNLVVHSNNKKHKQEKIKAEEFKKSEKERKE